MIEVREASYDKGVGKKRKNILADISFNIQPGENLAVFGKARSGRKELLDLLVGARFPTKGAVVRSTRISWLLGSLPVDPKLTSYQYLRFVCRTVGEYDFDEISKRMVNMGYSANLMNKKMGALVGAERKFFGIALGLAIDFDVFAFERSFALKNDNSIVGRVSKLFHERRKTANIVVGLDKQHKLMDYCSVGLVLDKGEQVFYGGVERAFEIFKGLKAGQPELEEEETEEEEETIEDGFF